MAGPWVVYLIRTARGRLYTGITTDIERRFREHRDDPGGRGAKFFRTDRPLAIVHQEYYAEKGAALRRERELKALPASAKRALVAAEAAEPVQLEQ